MTQEIITSITVGQISFLILMTFRSAKSIFRSFLLAFWVWMIAFIIGVNELSWLMVLSLWIGPIILQGLVFAFFERRTAYSYFFGHLLGGALLLVSQLYGNLTYFALTVYALIYLSTIWIIFFRFSGTRGIGSKAPKRYQWFRILLFFITTSMITCLWTVWFPTNTLTGLTLSSLLAATSLSGWYLNKGSFVGPLKAEPKYAKSSLDQKEKYRILSQLNSQLNESKYLLDPSASLGRLAKKLHTTPPLLSQVINEFKGVSFFELLGQYRIAEAKKLLREPKFSSFKIDEIGEQVGYMSKSSFNTVFKKTTGITPSQYRDGVRDHDLERPKDVYSPFSPVRNSTFTAILNMGIMSYDFLKFYFRRFRRNRALNVLNTIGLVGGITSSLMIGIYLIDELSYDRFHERSEDIYRVAFINSNPQTRTPHPMAQAMRNEFPEVETAVSISPLYGPGLSKQSIYIRNPETNIMFEEPDGFAADSTFFDVFDFKLQVGNEKECLKKVGGLLISQSLADKYFPKQNPLGKMLEITTDKIGVEITGVFQDTPNTSHFHPNFILSYVTLKNMDPDDDWMKWPDYGHFNYLKLTPKADAKKLAKKMPKWLFSIGQLTEEWYNSYQTGEWRFDLQPITDIHLKSHIRWELETNGNITYVYILITALAFIFLIILINYTNLSMAQSLERSKEIGVKRSLGANKASISLQFIGENTLTVLLCFSLSIVLACLFLDDYCLLTNKTFQYSNVLDLNLLSGIFLGCLLIGFISGALPVSELVKIKSSDIIKGKLGNVNKNSLLQKILVTGQFTVASILIFGSIILVFQVKFLESQPLGYNDEQVLVIDLKSQKVKSHVDALKNEIQKIPGVLQAGAISNIPGSQFNQNPVYLVENPDSRIDVSEMRGDFDFNIPLEFSLKEGRWFDRSKKADSLGQSLILNEKAVEQLAIENPIGTKIYWEDDFRAREGYIIGVVNNFHFQSLHVPIQPLVMEVNYHHINYLLVKTTVGKGNELIQKIKETYLAFDDQFGFEYSFLDQHNQQLYESEKRALIVFNLFAGIALGLAGIGLLGLAYLIVVQKTKEIGMRKVLGASSVGLVWKENSSFLKLIMVGVLTGLPMGYLIMKNWLDTFAYQTPVTIIPFALAMFMVISIGLVSVTFAVSKTAFEKPVKSLRYE